MPRIGWARNQARKLLNRFVLTSPPIDVSSVATQLGMRIVYHKFDSDFSSLLLCQRDEQIICVNKRHHPNRQRFSISHEIAHFLLHKDEAPHFDKDYEIYFRGNVSDSPDNEKEIEANQFAAELLMPLTMIRSDLRENPSPTASELAKKYQVSEQAMTFRLASLRPD